VSNTADLFAATLDELGEPTEPYPNVRTFDIYRRYSGAVGARPMPPSSAIYVAQSLSNLALANRTGMLDRMPVNSVGGLEALPASVGADYLFTPPYDFDTNSYQKAMAIGNGPYDYNMDLNAYQAKYGVAGQDFVGELVYNGDTNSYYSTVGTSGSTTLESANEDLIAAQNRLAAANAAFSANTDPDAIPGLMAEQTSALNAVAAASQVQQAAAAQAGSDFGNSIDISQLIPAAPGPAPSPVPVPVRPGPAPAPVPVAAKKKFPWVPVGLAAAALGAVVYHKKLGF